MYITHGRPLYKFDKGTLMTTIKILKKLTACVFLCAYAAYLNASGFALYEFSARGNAMGGAVMANKAEPASLATNPALITKLEGTQIQMGSTFIRASAETTIDGAEQRNNSNDTYALPNFYATYQSREDLFLGLAVYSRFGSGNSYPNETLWGTSGKAYSVKAEAISVMPIIATKLTPSLSLSLGIEAMMLSLNEKMYKSAGGYNSDIEIDGNGISYGGNASLLYEPQWAEQWAFGLSYKSKVRQVVDGTLKSSDPHVAPSDDVRGSVTLPDMFMAGLSYQATPKLVMEAGVIYTFWSSYDAIRIDYKNFTIPTTTYPLSIIDEKKYKDAPRFNIGAEYALNKNWDLRAGYTYDKASFNTNNMDTLVPMSDNHMLNAGFGYKTDVWGLDFSYTYQIGKDAFGKTTEGDTISYTNSYSNMVAMSFKYKFNTPFLSTIKKNL